MDFLKNLKIDDKPQEPTSAPTHASSQHQQHNLFDKLGDVIDNLSDKQSPPPPPPEPKKPEGLFDKIGDALMGEKKPPTPPPPPPKPEGLFDKISDVLHGGKEEQPPPKPQTFGDKLQDKLSGALGGGSAGEAKEDKLDKTIDYLQEHVLKGGKQDDESALEQAKDKQIANAVREGYKSVTGHEFFVKEKQ